MKNIIIISSPEFIKSEHRKIVALFNAGLQQFHIRKPEFSDFDMINYIGQIPKKYHRFLVLHSHYYLAKDFKLKGIQVGQNRMKEALPYLSDFEYCGYSAHSFDEIEEHQSTYSHFFISPVFNSISKPSYTSNFTLEELNQFSKRKPDLNLIALGGIDEKSIEQIKHIAFSAYALLGAVWQSEEPESIFEKLSKLLNKRPYVLSIAGFDPSSGAGITADIKTFEQHKVLGLAVTTSITYQNESEFEAVDYLSFSQIKQQLDLLFKIYPIDYVKIGLIQDFNVLSRLIAYLKMKNRGLKIIWDPILESSSGFKFHKGISEKDLFALLKSIYLITPNLNEVQQIFGTKNTEDLQLIIQENGLQNILLKGGHSLNNKVDDWLIEAQQKQVFSSDRIQNGGKHGTGCILSSAICANLSSGHSLASAVGNAKHYIQKIISSNDSLLAYHNID